MKGLAALGGLLALLQAQPSQAEEFPSRPIRLIVPFAAGGPNDVIARVIGQEMTTEIGQPVVVENRAGASGTLGIGLVARADPDGYTIGLTASGPLSIVPNLQKTPYDWRTDLSILSIVMAVPEIMAVPADFPAKTASEFVDLVRKNPNKFNFASVGRGTLPHLAGEYLKLSLGLDMAHVPYAGAAPAITDLLNNRTQLLIVDVSVLQSHIQQGTLRGLAIADSQRYPALPEIPTTTEAGIPALQINNWYALLTSSKVPSDVQKRIVASLNAVLKVPSVRSMIADQGGKVVGSSQPDPSGFLDAESRRWEKVIRDAKLAVD